MRSCDRLKEGICTKKEENISLIQRRECVYWRKDKKEIYSTIKVTIDCTSIFCRKEEWEEENGIRLLVP